MKKFVIPFIAAILLIFQSCSVDTKTTYYKDAATAMQSDIVVDQSMASMMNMTPGNSNPLPDLQGLTTDWKSFYELQKNGKITVNADSAQVLKKLFLKLNKVNGETAGISIKYDKLMPEEIVKLFAQNKKLRQIPLQDMAKWDGKTLTIDTEKFSNAGNLTEIFKPESASKTPASKQDSIASYGREMAQGALGLMKMFNMKYSNTLKFQKPIKSIIGRSDFVKQIDNNTVKITVNSKELFDDDKAKQPGDKQIIITTE